MMEFKRHPEVCDLLLHYANTLQREDVVAILQQGIKTHADAQALGLFVWRMADAIAEDEENQKPVLGRLDNIDMLADVDEEITHHMAVCGFGDVWQKMCE